MEMASSLTSICGDRVFSVYSRCSKAEIFMKQLSTAAELQERHERQGVGQQGAGAVYRACQGHADQVIGQRVGFPRPPEPHVPDRANDELRLASIRNGKPIYNGEYMARSTLLAIMGRMAAYTGQEITWEMAMNSKETLSPSRYDWDAQPPSVEVAIPGQTRYM